ncbi:SDR family oxidoreductase [Paracidovorax citrulli]|uniref:SDR family oxidoreductase n=1 Tax=Paracidovorax citrulli TaxID=80869 RepID=UPI0003178846|nr:SDR family oxidoreductase [Paracidovorax citrulli]QCX09889.1 NAD(P)H azoreductase [Paracidovorax citrulli]UEG47116.1 SDR family oxidoreductase [Paracidovorax citrulli]UMT93684.1 SDR family oxidoreductase [Paracidovorax citrulli]
MILVCGATGGIGGELCKLLKAAGAPFRAMARRQEQVDRFRQQGMDAVLGDFDRPETLAAAMQGCDTMFLITPPNPDQFTQETGAIDAAKRAGVGRVVKISASDGNVRTPVPWARTHALIDHHLRAAGIGWTLLKPTAFMQNFLWFKKPIAKGFLPQVTGDGSVSWVDTRDVARVAAAVLTQEGHAGATYFLTGPETLDMHEAAKRLSHVTGHQVRYLNLPTFVFRAMLRLTGNSAWMAKGLVVQFADVVAGHHDIDPTFEIERLTGQPARRFDDFIRDHRDAFARHGS